MDFNDKPAQEGDTRHQHILEELQRKDTTGLFNNSAIISFSITDDETLHIQAISNSRGFAGTNRIMFFSLLIVAEGIFTKFLNKTSFRITYESALPNPNYVYGNILFGDIMQDVIEDEDSSYVFDDENKLLQPIAYY